MSKAGVMNREQNGVERVKPPGERDLAAEWDRVAEDRDILIAEGRDLSYRHILLPALRRLSGSWLRGDKRILDVGCGTGRFAAGLAEDFPSLEVVAIDPSNVSVEIATKQRIGVDNLTFRCTSVESFAQKNTTAKFNLVIANMLFQNVASLKDVLNACVRMLAQDGALVFAIPHPCFWPRYWKYDREPWFNYNDELWIEAPFRTSLSPNAQIRTTHTHRPLSSYMNAFRQVGLCVDELAEPYPDEGVEGEYPDAWEYPRFLLGRCCIQPDSRAGANERLTGMKSLFVSNR
jgi:ubiquinone/menaquinone biosynthesis C-methylase UbiE